MKIVVGFLIVAVVALTIAVSMLVTPRGSREAELTVAQLAEVLGIHHWRYRVPDHPDDEMVMLGLEFVTPEGSYSAGAYSSAWSGEVVKIFIRPVDEGEKLRFSFMSTEPRVWRTNGITIRSEGTSTSFALIDNALHRALNVQYAPSRGELVENGVLMKGARELEQPVSFDESSPHDIMLRVVVRDDIALPRDRAAGEDGVPTATASGR